VLALCAELLRQGGLAKDTEQGEAMATACLSSGRAAERFASMVRAQGGPADLLDRPGHYLADAPVVRAVTAREDGYVAHVDTQAVGNIVVRLGGGRRRAEDAIDPSVGFSDLKMPGERVGRGEPLARVHAADATGAESAASALAEAYRLAAEPPTATPVVHRRIEGEA
jgi:thymidine phosphorylase